MPTSLLPHSAVGLPPSPLFLEVDVAPQLAEIHDEFAPLLRLSGICAVQGSGAGVAPNGTSTSAAHSGSDEEDVRGRRSPAMSPVRAAESKLAELTAPVAVLLPPPMSNEDVAFIAQYVRRCRAQEESERLYIALVFQEYKKRKSVELKRETEVAAWRGELVRLRERELPPEVRAAASEMAANETAARAAVLDAHDKFVVWVAETTPQWVEAAQRAERQRLENESAKKAAMAAAREALALELAMGRQLDDVSGRSSPQSAGVVAGVNEDGTLSYDPVVSIAAPARTPGEATEVLSPTELRRKAIHMLEAEEAEVKRRREGQLRLLRVQEEQLRAEMALKAQHDQAEAERREREAAQTREDDMARRYDALLQEEFAVQQRLREREEAERLQETERQTRLAAVAAEEEQLRRRLKEAEDRRVASEEETARVAREAKMREVREQEEQLRQRIATRTAAAEAERQAREAEARIHAEAAAVRAQQAEALQRANAQREQSEKERQLAYLREQEEAYKRRLREKELAEIEEKRRAAEAQWRHSTAAAAAAGSAPAWAGHSAFTASPSPMVAPGMYHLPAHAPSSAYPPAMPHHGYQSMPTAPVQHPPPSGGYYTHLGTPAAGAMSVAGMPAPPPRPDFGGYAVPQPYAQPYPYAAAGAPVYYPGPPHGGASPAMTAAAPSPYAPAAMYPH
ncbi:hypothetical protein NESM_000454100 [Novymonas esmeraldas]|uniref:Uncharacterized protein n=1 Tax=Novymonas esmeraldas TaxID=1808958 RepID=A0AAW0EM67_9TRYP